MKFCPSSSSCLVLFCLVVATTLKKNARAFNALVVPHTTTMSPSTTTAAAFSLQQRRRPLVLSSRHRAVHLLFAASSSSSYNDNSNDNNNNDERPRGRSYEEALEHNRKRTDVRRFLTQRALQSFIYLLIECRDPHTVRWLENTYKFGNLEQYHGTGAGLNLANVDDTGTEFGATRSSSIDEWDTMLLDLLHRPNDKVIVAARRRGRGHGGWSKNNPHLEDRFVEFEIDIEPASLVTRIVSVRNQIAQEWANSDLDLLDTVTQMILSSYHEHQNAQRQAEEKECINFDSDNDNDGSVASDGEDGECISIESLTAPYAGGSSSGVSSGGDVASSSRAINRDPLSLNSLTRDNAYDRIAMEFLNNKMLSDEMGSSPQRKGNFDLLTLLATQEAVHRVLRGYKDDPSQEREVSLTWLREFYIPRIPTYFDGDGKYSRADDFLQELLLTPPMTKRIMEENNNNSNRMMMALIDPLRIAEDILKQRSLVAKEWKEIMQHQVPSDHMKLQREILTVRMSPPPPPPSREQNAMDSSSSSNPNEEMGHFE